MKSTESIIRGTPIDGHLPSDEFHDISPSSSAEPGCRRSAGGRRSGERGQQVVRGNLPRPRHGRLGSESGDLPSCSHWGTGLHLGCMEALAMMSYGHLGKDILLTMKVTGDFAKLGILDIIRLFSDKPILELP